MLCDDVVIGKASDEIDCFTVYFMYTIENIPDGMFVSWKCRVKDINILSSEERGSAFPYF